MKHLILITIILKIVNCQTQANKLVLDQNTVVPITYYSGTVAGQPYQRIIATLSLGLGETKGSNPQEGKFAIEFNDINTLVHQYDVKNPTGFNFTEDLGFSKTSNTPIRFNYRGEGFYSYPYTGWMRFDNKKNSVSVQVPKSKLYFDIEGAKWFDTLGISFGLVGLGKDSMLFDSLLNTYKLAQGASPELPVSFSLSPKNENYIFDSRAEFFENTFILNGYRATGAQYGKAASVVSGTWYYPSMDFRMGSKWSSYKKEVCVDPNVDAFIALPSQDYEKVWQIIQADTCGGKSTTDCDYSKATLSKMTPFDICLKSTSASQSNFQTHLSLQGSDMVKKDASNTYLPKGIADSSKVRTVCSSGDIIMGRWFFTKAEVTIWLSTDNSRIPLLSFAEIASDNQKQRDAAGSSGSGLLLVLVVVVVVLAAAAGGAFYYFKKVKPAQSGSGYQKGPEETQHVSYSTFDGRK